jgi:hypothetical protein
MSPKETRIAIVIVAMAAASAAVLLYGMKMNRDAHRLGPIRSVTVADRELLTIFHADRLHVLNSAGKRLASQPLAELALAEQPNDMDLTVDAKGKVQAWFFDDSVPKLVRCDVAPDTLRFARCAQVAAGPELKIEQSSRAVHLAVDIAHERIFIADADGHAVRMFGLDGRRLRDSPPGELYFPNRLRVAGDQLVVADNDHRRIVWLDITGDTPSFAPLRTLLSGDHPQARSGHRKVADFAFVPGANGEPVVLWMLAVAQGQKFGDVLTWDAALKPGERANLGGHTDPLALDRLGDAAVVADFNGVALYRIGAHGDYLGPFGEPAFQGELREAAAQISDAVLWKYAAWACFAATLVIGFLLAFRFSESPGAALVTKTFAAYDTASAEVPPGRVELLPGRWYVRQMGAMAIGLGGLALVAPALLAFGTRGRLLPPAVPGWFMALVALALLALYVALAFGLWHLWRMAQRSLVLVEGRAEVRHGLRTLASVPVLEVMASPQALLIGRAMLPYRMTAMAGRPGRWIFEEDRLVRYVLAHVPPGQRIAQPALTRVAMKRMPVWQQLAIGVPFLVVLAFELWRTFGR